ncbi:hypothetical protein MIR68_008790 [Amoeboaphelidium protococcarum]|nr:hypothetical protein MIR68_008790 [Amoeboaphelidium protococcarum]
MQIYKFCLLALLCLMVACVNAQPDNSLDVDLFKRASKSSSSSSSSSGKSGGRSSRRYIGGGGFYSPGGNRPSNSSASKVAFASNYQLMAPILLSIIPLMQHAIRL